MHYKGDEVMQMGSATINVRIDADTKRAAEKVFSQMGLSPTQAIRLFYRQTVNSNALPFRPSLSSHVHDAIADLEAGRTEEVTLTQLKEELNAID